MSDEKTDYGLLFSIDDHEFFVNHWMLQDVDVAVLISNTPEYKADDNPRGKKLTARVTVNGIELPFKSLEGLFQHFYDSQERHIRKQYSDLEAEVERRLVERLKTEGQPILDKLYDLQQVLEDPSQLLTPYWERKEQNPEPE